MNVMHGVIILTTIVLVIPFVGYVKKPDDSLPRGIISTARHRSQ